MTLKWVQPSSLVADFSAQEQMSYDYFRNCVIASLPGVYEAKLWNKIILPVSLTEPAVRHAVLALGAFGLRRENGSGSVEENDRFALQHYSKAMKVLQSKISEEKKLSPDLILITCLLFVIFELQNSGWLEAKAHCSGGTRIIREMREDLLPISKASKTAIQPLVDAFERMDIQMSLFTSDRVQLNQSRGPGTFTRLPVDMEFETLYEPSCTLNVMMCAMRELVMAVEHKKFTPQGVYDAEYPAFEYEQTKQLVSLARWEEAMESLIPDLVTPRDRQTAAVLQMLVLTTKLKVAECFNEGREMRWDAYLPEFTRIVGLAETVLSQNEQDLPNANRLAFPSFTTDMGAIPTLNFTVLKCRDPYLRQKALLLLGNCKHQEGVWDGPTHALSAASIVRLEERGLIVLSPSDLPETSRLYRAWLDLSKPHGRHVIYCERRAWESDGRWLSWQERVE
jgi:hypothetical protein